MNKLLLLRLLAYLVQPLFPSSIIFLLQQMLLVHLLLQILLYIKFLGRLLYECFFQLQLELDNHIIFPKSLMDLITLFNHIFHSQQMICVESNTIWHAQYQYLIPYKLHNLFQLYELFFLLIIQGT
jgi:hypothetical protein